jgi:hypothetical protein
MGPDVLALLIPIVAILAVFGVGALRVWIGHRERLEALRVGQAEREAERDRELLGLGNPLGSAHLEAVLARLTALEDRLKALEGGAPVAPAVGAPVQTPVTPGAVLSGSSGERQQRRETNLA